MANEEEDFVAKVALKIDPASLEKVGQQIKAALEGATRGIDLKAISELAKSVKILADDTAKAATNAEKLKQAQERTNQEVQKTLLAKQRIATEEQRTLAVAARAATESERSAKAAEQEAKYTAAIADARARATQANSAFTLGNLGGALGNNFLSTLLSGGNLSSALSQSLGKLQPALFDVAQGGETAAKAFGALGIEGVGTVSALTSGMAALGVAALAVVPVIGAIGQGIKGAYDQQKEFVFQSGLLAKQLGTTAEEGAKLRALLTLVGQEDNIFAAITLNQIQAAVASLDRVNKGLETASPQVEKFGQALNTLGVSYAKNNGSLKTFAELVVDISAGLQNLDTAQRSLAIQNLAGLFGSDVAKIFGFGPDGLSTVLQGAVVVTNEQSKANDDLQISLANLTAAQTAFNIQLANGLTPLETWVNTFKTGALREGADVLGEIYQRITGINAAALEGGGGDLGAGLVRGYFEFLSLPFLPTGIALNALFPDEAALRSKAENLKEIISLGGSAEELALYGAQLKNVQAILREMAADRLGGRDLQRGGVFDAGAASTAALKLQYGELEKALDAADKASKEFSDTQKDIAKNNLDVAKSFDTQINAIQKAATEYDKYYSKVADTLGKIGEIQAKEGKPFTFIGTGTVKDVEKAVVDLRVLEERLAGMAEKGVGIGAPRFDQLALNIRKRREALGLQAGELTDLKNIDISVGITNLSKADRQELNDLFQQLLEFKNEFLRGGFDVAQNTFKNFVQDLSQSLSGAEFNKLLVSGAQSLQDYAESVGLFSSPGFSQAIGEAALQAKLLAGGFGDLNTAAGASGAFDEYTGALQGFLKDLFGLTDFISGGKSITVPIAISFGLVTQGTVDLASIDPGALKSQAEKLVAAGEITIEEYRNQIQAAADARTAVTGLGSGKGIVDLLLGKYGIRTDEAIEATAKFAIDAEFDVSLAGKSADAAFKKLKAEQEAKERALVLNISVDAIFNTEAIRARLQGLIDALAPGLQLPAPTPPGGGGGGGGGGPRPVAEAAGGNVFKGMPYLVGEEGKPELFMPRSDGRIIPGNETASLMRLLGGSQRTPSVPSITYAPVTQQYLNVDARGTNAREVTQAIKRTQAKQSLFTSSSAIVRDRDFLRAHGIR